MTEIIALCNRCKGTATGKTFTEASARIDHGIGRVCGIPCGDSYNAVNEIKTEKPKEQILKIPKEEKPKTKRTTKTIKKKLTPSQ